MQRRKPLQNVLFRITLAALLIPGLIAGLIAGMAFAPSASAQAPPPSTVTLMVKFAAGMSAADRQALMDKYGATVKSDVNKLGIEVVEIPADNAATVEQNLRQEPGVLRVEESKTRKVQALPNDAQVGSQWALPQIAWDQVYGTVTPQYLTKVAILDTGVDATHTDLMGSIAPGTSIIDSSNGLTDLNGHGTWLAGIVAARTNNIDGIAGVGFSNVQVMPVKVADANGDAQDDDVVNGVMYAADNGASVILMAFSNPGFSASLQDAIDYAWSKNVVLVAAMGNDGSSAATFPAGDRGVMGVSATDQSDNLAAGSNYGQDVFIAAPGVSILGTGLSNTYVAMSGTSASAAIVAGAAALMRAVDPTLPNGVVVSRLARNADPAGTQAQTGNGRVQLARAIADTDTTSIEPAGAAPVGGGGPFVGPYHIAARNWTLTFLGTGTGSITLTPDTGTINAAVSCGGTGTAVASQTITSSCSSITTSANGATITASVNAAAGSIFAGWSNPSNLSPNSCALTATPCSFVITAGSASIDATFNGGPPTISKAFAASTIALNGTTTLTFTLTNPNTATNQTNVAFSDALTGGLQVNSTPGVVNNCGGTVTAAANSASISLSGGTITHASNCTISVTVEGTAAGTVNNTTGAVSSTNGGTGTTSNTASLVVDGAAPVITVSFTAPDGTNGWHKTAPVSGSVSATDSANVDLLSCTDTLGGLTQGSLTGADTTTASRTLSVTGEGTHNISCTATDGVGNAGAGAGSTAMPVVVKIDTVAPTVTAAADRVADHNGWYNHSLTVTFRATDATSDAVTCDSPVTYTGPDSATASVTGHCTDSAGNQGTGTLNFKYDGTGPTAALSITAGTAGTNGWYTSDVTVHTAGTDTVSSPVTCTADQQQTTETAGTAFNGSCTNDAGLSTNATALNVKLDKTAPTATLAVTAGTAGTNGWYTSDVTIGASGTDSISTPVVCTADQHQTTETIGATFNGTCTNDAGLHTDAAPLNVKLDKTAPVVNLSVTAGTAGTNGWYTSDVTVHTAGTETISNPISCGADQFQTTETSGTPFNGSCTNDAGLTGNATALNIKLDKTGPTATLAVSAGTLGAHGWYTSDVTVHASGTDSISSPVACSADQFLTTETTGTAFNGSCTNDAGLSTNATALNVKLDKTAPTAVALAVTAGTLGANGWYTSDVTVHTSGTETVSNPITCTLDQIQSAETAGTPINGSCTNDAGLTGNATALNIKLDKTGPTATLAVSAGTPGTNGWYTSDVTVHATGTDTISSPVTCTADQFQTTETNGATFNATCTNNAGLHTDATALTVKLDKTPPTAVALAVTAGTLGANGWYTSDVTIGTSGTDSISTPVVCTADQHQTAETTGATFNGTCTNDAGLHADAAPLSIKLDKTPPTATLAVSAGTLGANGWYTSDVTIHASGTDTISAPVTCSADQSQTAETTGATFNASCTNDAGLSANAAPLTVKLDKTPPTAVTLTPTGTLGTNGWYISDVTIGTSGTETISTPITCTADQHQTTDTTGTAFNGSCTNNAGLSASATAINIKRDATPPTVTAAPDRPADHNGWYNHSVSITFTGADSTSGVFTCDPVAPYSGPDSATASVSGHCTDNAGNVGTGTFNFKFDSTPPSAALAVTAGTLGANGWYTSDITISTSGADSVSRPVSCTADQHQTTETTGATFNGSCTNDAGLSTNAAPLSVKLDKTAPTGVALSVTAGTLGTNGWYISNVTVHTTGSDSISGPVTCTADQNQTTDTTGTNFNGSCTNNAGLSANAASLNIKLDKTLPAATIVTMPANPTNSTSATFTFTATDATSGVGTVTCQLDLGVPAPCAGTQSYSPLAQGSHTFTVFVTDNASNASSASYMWVVDTTPPIVSAVTLSSYAVPMGSNTTVTLTANINDTTTGNSNITAAEYNVNGGTWTAFTTVTPALNTSSNVNVSANLSGFATATVLDICVRGTDAGGNASVPTAAQCAILAVYDPSAGFVTGGGWIISPVKAGYPYMAVSGKANFGFVSQYKKGQTVPTGNTQFQFQEGNLDFESSAYQWLVVSGSKAQFQGTGTINGTGNYGFQVFAYDGSVKGSGTDMDGFRIQIGTLLPDGSLTNIVYDNMFTGTSSPGSGTEPLDKVNGNGSIQIH